MISRKKMCRGVGFVFLAVLWISCGSSGGGSDSGGSGSADLPTGNATGGERNPVCAAGQSAGEVQAPVFRMNLAGRPAGSPRRWWRTWTETDTTS